MYQGPDRSHGLLKYGNVMIPFEDHYPKNTQSYKLMTSKMTETTPQRGCIMSRGFDDEPHAALKPSDGNSRKTKAFGHASDSLFAGKMKGTADSAKDDISAAKKASQGG